VTSVVPPVAETTQNPSPALTPSQSSTPARSTDGSTQSSATVPAAVDAAVPTDEEVTAAETDDALVESDEVVAEERRKVTATPSESVGPIRVAVPALGVMALASALLALEVTKRPRRSLRLDASPEDAV